jgi:hypothetical protein
MVPKISAHAAAQAGDSHGAICAGWRTPKAETEGHRTTTSDDDVTMERTSGCAFFGEKTACCALFGDDETTRLWVKHTVRCGERWSLHDACTVPLLAMPGDCGQPGQCTCVQWSGAQPPMGSAAREGGCESNDHAMSLYARCGPYGPRAAGVYKDRPQTLR